MDKIQGNIRDSEAAKFSFKFVLKTHYRSNRMNLPQPGQAVSSFSSL